MSTGDEGALSGTSQFVAALVVNAALGIIFCLAFSFLRRRMPWCYDPRRVDTIRNPGYKPGDAYLTPPPRQSKGFFSWIPQSLKMSDDEMLRVAGVDAVMTVRFFRYCFYYFSFISIFSVVIILPIQYLSDGGMEGFNRLSLSNIPEGSHRTAVNVVFAYIFTGSLLFMLYLLWQANVVSQSKWMANEQFCGRKLTLLVEGLPPAYRSDGKLLRFFQTLFDRGVSGASVVKIAEELQALTAERDTCVQALNHAQGARETDFKTPYARRQHKLKMCCPSDAEKVDLIDHFTQRIREIDEKIANVKASSLKAASCGLVTFTSAAAAAAASQVPIVSNFGRFSTRWAPEPREIIWSGIRMDPWVKWIMGLVMTVAHFFLVFFWSIPIGFISSLTSLESLGKVLPFLEPLVDMSPALKGFLEGFLPALAMTIFMAVLPKILAAMGRAQGIECQSWIEMYVLRKYFVFQIFNFFLLTALASSVFKQMEDIIDHPTSIVTLLAESIPASANVFIAYVMLRALSANFMELAQVVRWVLCIILGFISSTPEEFVGKWNPDPFKYGKLIPEALLVFTIGFCFAPIQPILVIFVALFFATGYLVHKYMFAFINVAVFETGGCFWPLTFNRIIVGALVSQVTLIGILGLKKVVVESCVLIPLPFLTIWFWYYCDVNYTIKFNNPALIDAVLTDKDRVKLTAADKAVILSSGVIMRPVAEDILPLLMPAEFADSVQREKRIKAYSLDEAEEDAKLVNVFPSSGKDAELADTNALRARLNQEEKKYLSAAVYRGRRNGKDEDEDFENDIEANPRGAQTAIPLTSSALPSSDSGLNPSASVMSPLASETANKILADLRAEYQRVTGKSNVSEEPEAESGAAEDEVPVSDLSIKKPKGSRPVQSSAEIGGAIAGETDDERMMARIALLRYSQPELAPVRFGVRVTSRVWPPVYLDSLRNEYNDKKGTQILPYEVVVTSSERRNDAAAYNAADITGRALCPSGLDPNGSSSPVEAAEPVPRAVSSPRASGKAFFPASPAAALATDEAAPAETAAAAAESKAAEPETAEPKAAAVPAAAAVEEPAQEAESPSAGEAVEMAPVDDKSDE